MMTLLVFLLPLAGAAGVLVLRRHHVAAPAVAVATVGAVLLLGGLAAVTEAALSWSWGGPLQLGIAAEGFSRVMVVLIPAIAIPVLVFAAYSEHHGRARLLALLTAFVGAMQLLVLATDLLTLLIAWELVGATSWALIGHGWRDPANGAAASQAFVTTRIGDLGLYIAAGATFAGTGSLGLASIAELEGGWLALAAAGIVLAATAKSAQLPFSPWLFSAMAGPTPASALLHSATLVSAGAYLLIRTGPDLARVAWFAPTVITIGLATALAAGVVAVWQTAIKRVLAGSTSAQYGLMFLAVGAGSTAAAGAQLVTHAVFKALLFIAAGIAIHAVATDRLDRMGLGPDLRLTAVWAAVGALALAAVPPLGGAWSKEQVLGAAMERSVWLGGATLLVAFLTAVYAGRFWLLAYGPRTEADRPVDELDHPPTRAEVGALGALAVASLLLGALWLPGSKSVVETLTAGVLPHASLLDLALASIAIALAASLVARWWRRGRLTTLGASSDGLRRAAASWLGLPALARTVVVDPTLRLSGFLARRIEPMIADTIDGAAVVAAAIADQLRRRGEPAFERVIDTVGGGGDALARGLDRYGEPLTDVPPRAVAASFDATAGGLRSTGDPLLDRVMEGVAVGTGRIGRVVRRAQIGLVHRYLAYAIAIAIALLVLVLVLSP